MWEVFDSRNGRTLAWSRTEIGAIVKGITLVNPFWDYDYTPMTSDPTEQIPFPRLKHLVPKARDLSH